MPGEKHHSKDQELRAFHMSLYPRWAMWALLFQKELLPKYFHTSTDVYKWCCFRVIRYPAQNLEGMAQGIALIGLFLF